MGALVNDKDVAKALVDKERESGLDGKQEWRPPIAEYGLTEKILADVVNELRILVLTVQAFGSKPGQFKPYPAPQTVLDSVRQESVEASYYGLLERLTPGATTE